MIETFLDVYAFYHKTHRLQKSCLYKTFVNNLVCFVIFSADELEKIAYQTSQLNYHRYFILVGFESSKNARFISDTDSFIEIKEYDKNVSFLKRLILCYSLPNYENIALYTSNNIISLNDLQQLFHSLMNGEHTNKDYLISISRADFVFNSTSENVESVPVNQYGEIIARAMDGEMLSYEEMKISLIELLPERNLTLDESCGKMPFELQNIILEHNKKNYLTKTNVYYNKIKEHEECIMFFDLPSSVENFSFKICSIEGFEVYFRL